VGVSPFLCRFFTAFSVAQVVQRECAKRKKPTAS
jgi:hypothetical protein